MGALPTFDVAAVFPLGFASGRSLRDYPTCLIVPILPIFIVSPILMELGLGLVVIVILDDGAVGNQRSE